MDRNRIREVRSNTVTFGVWLFKYHTVAMHLFICHQVTYFHFNIIRSFSCPLIYSHLSLNFICLGHFLYRTCSLESPTQFNLFTKVTSIKMAFVCITCLNLPFLCHAYVSFLFVCPLAIYCSDLKFMQLHLIEEE